MEKNSETKAILSFLKRINLAVISTVNTKGLPDAAPIYFLAEEDLSILFITPINSQKSLNLKIQNEAVLTITDEEEKVTVEIRGRTEERGDLLGESLLKLTEKLNGDTNFVKMLPFLKHKGQKKTVIKVKPYEIRMRSYTKEGMEEVVI